MYYRLELVLGRDMRLVNECSEGEILEVLLPFLPRGANTVVGSGDDCAVISSRGQYVVTSDVLVEGRHFRLDWSTGYEIGWRSAMQNLADVAAMGAEPVAMEVSLAMPGETSLEWVKEFGRGIGQALEGSACGVVGGDLSGSSMVMVGVTVQGECRNGVEPVLRSGAQPGDIVAVAGTLGRSLAGFCALNLGAVAPDLHGSDVPEPFREVVQIFRAPTPPLSAGVLAAESGATAMMDVSDGLLLDARRLARASGVRIDFSSAMLEADIRAVEPIAAILECDPWHWVLGGGEDHALLATFPATSARLAECVLPDGFRPIGKVSASNTTGPLVTIDNRSVNKNCPIGWQHFNS